MKLENWIQLSGLAHVGLLTAGATMMRVTGFEASRATLPPFHRQLFAVYAGFVGGMLAAFALVGLFMAPELADGSRMSRAVCGAIAVFHGARLMVQFLVFDVREFLTNGWLRLGYQVTTVTFTALMLLFAGLAVGTLGS
jgi:uncharacterized membrane-anchored protein YitT (DUF2179 family)